MLVQLEKFKHKDRAVVTSLDVAETFGKEHRHVLRDIKELPCDREFHVSNFGHISYKDSYGRDQPMYIMTRDGFTLLVMGYTGDEAMRFKIAYINQFNQMEETIRKRIVERERGIAVRNALTNALQVSEEQRMHGHAYSNYTNAIYRVLFGKDAKQMREEMGVEETANLRDHMNAEQLSAVESMERLVSGLVDVGMSYDKIKEFIESFNTKRMLTGE